jgi:hypothetical protein
MLVIVAVDAIIPWRITDSDEDNRQREMTAINKPYNNSISKHGSLQAD